MSETESAKGKESVYTRKGMGRYRYEHESRERERYMERENLVVMFEVAGLEAPGPANPGRVVDTADSTSGRLV